jgi:hypothetical protein
MKALKELWQEHGHRTQVVWTDDAGGDTNSIKKAYSEVFPGEGKQ